jgi:predicted nucleic acid-binding protein
MIPSVVLSEYLAGFQGATARREQSAAIAKRFFVPGFDAPAASIAAELMSSPSALSARDEVGRRHVKADAQIIGTAIQHGAEKIVTGNLAEYKTLAAGRIEVIEIPVISFQALLDLPLLGESN